MVHRAWPLAPPTHHTLPQTRTPASCGLITVGQMAYPYGPSRVVSGTRSRRQDGIEDKTNQEEDPDAPRTGQSRLRLRRARAAARATLGGSARNGNKECSRAFQPGSTWGLPFGVTLSIGIHSRRASQEIGCHSVVRDGPGSPDRVRIARRREARRLSVVARTANPSAGRVFSRSAPGETRLGTR